MRVGFWGLEKSWHQRASSQVQKETCVWVVASLLRKMRSVIPDKEIELLMFCTRQRGGEYSIKSYQRGFLLCKRVCVCVSTFLPARVCVAGFELVHMNTWHRPLYHKRHLLIMSRHNVPPRRLQEGLIKNLLLSACDVAALVDVAARDNACTVFAHGHFSVAKYVFCISFHFSSAPQSEF